LARRQQERARFAALEARVARIEQEREELAVWVAALERRQALADELTLATDLRVHALLQVRQRE